MTTLIFHAVMSYRSHLVSLAASCSDPGRSAGRIYVCASTLLCPARSHGATQRSGEDSGIQGWLPSRFAHCLLLLFWFCLGCGVLYAVTLLSMFSMFFVSALYGLNLYAFYDPLAGRFHV